MGCLVLEVCLLRGVPALGNVPGPGGVCVETLPKWLLLRAVRILLECILVVTIDNCLYTCFNKEASRLYAELCEPILKFFILLSCSDPDPQAPHTPTPITFLQTNVIYCASFLNLAYQCSMCPEAGSILIAGGVLVGIILMMDLHYAGLLMLVPYGQCVTQVARGDIVIILD